MRWHIIVKNTTNIIVLLGAYATCLVCLSEIAYLIARGQLEINDLYFFVPIIFFLILGSKFIYSELTKLKQEHTQFDEIGIRTSAIVTSQFVYPKGHKLNSVISYEFYIDNILHEGHGNIHTWDKIKTSIGDNIDIIYSPDNPAKVMTSWEFIGYNAEINGCWFIILTPIMLMATLVTIFLFSQFSK